MKFFYALLFTALLSLLLQLFLPWWSLVAAAALAGAIFTLGAFPSFLSGFFGAAVVWWVYAWFLDSKNNSLLSTRIAELLHLGSPLLLILLCGVVAGIAGGLAAVSGRELRQLF